GLYLNPPDHAIVLGVDEKTQVQALDRTQPMLPLGLGYVEGVTHDYERHGTTTLFAALDLASGRVFTQCKHRHRHQEFLQFLRHIEAFVKRYNHHCRPFSWTATADSIFEKIGRLCKAVAGTGH